MSLLRRRGDATLDEWFPLHELEGPRCEATFLPRSYEVAVHDDHGTIKRTARARRPEEALRRVQIDIDYTLRVNVTSRPATIRRLDTGEVWESPGGPART